MLQVGIETAVGTAVPAVMLATKVFAPCVVSPVKGRLVALVKTSAVGVPKAGATRVRPEIELAVAPKLTDVDPIVIAELARAALGMAEAATVSWGVVAPLATVGTNHVGHDPPGAVNTVTDPAPVLDPVILQVIGLLPEQLPAPALKVKTAGPATVLILVVPPADGEKQVPLPSSKTACPLGHPNSFRDVIEALPITT